MRLLIATTTALFVSLSLGTYQFAYSDNANRADKAHGKDVFNHWCAPCHAAGPNHPGTQALEAKYMGKLPAALEERRDLKKNLVRTFVRQGVSIMPFFRQTEITDGDLDALGTYLSK